MRDWSDRKKTEIHGRWRERLVDSVERMQSLLDTGAPSCVLHSQAGIILRQAEQMDPEAAASDHHRRMQERAMNALGMCWHDDCLQRHLKDDVFCAKHRKEFDEIDEDSDSGRILDLL